MIEPMQRAALRAWLADLMRRPPALGRRSREPGGEEPPSKPLPAV